MSISSETSECAICLEDKEGFIAHLSCGHSYHYSCVQSWIKKKNNYRKCCCICENDTEIVKLIGEHPPVIENKKTLLNSIDLLSCCTIL